MANADSNSLFRCPVKVRRGPGCDMPAHLLGAYVDCFVAAPDYMAALRLAVEKLSLQGYVFEDLREGRVHQLDPLMWDQFVASTWSEFADHFPPQAEVLRVLKEGGVFFGPFCAWETEA